MTIPRTPSDDFELLDLDGPTTHPDTNDSRDHFAALVESTQTSVLPSANKNDQSERPPMLEIDSFVPVIDQLSNATRLADNSLHIRGAVSKADLEALSSFASRVGTFILRDLPSDLKPGGCTISPGTYIRLAQLHNPESPFFPSLKLLRIVDPDSSLANLNFLLTNSLRSIELVNLTDSNEEVFSSFLITLADECPRLSSITLGQDPGRRLSSSLLSDCLKFTHLRELELKDVLSALDFQLLVTIGQALPELESFILNARTAKYLHRMIPPTLSFPQPAAEGFSADGSTPVPQEVDIYGDDPLASLGNLPSAPSFSLGYQPAFGEPAPPQLFEEAAPPSSPQAEKAEPSFISPPTSFLLLNRLHITAELTLIKDLVNFVGSTVLKDMALTLVRSTPPRIDEQWKTSIKKPGKGSGKGGKSITSRIRTTTLVDMESPSFVSLVEEAVYTTWKTTLTKLYLGQHEDYRPDLDVLGDVASPTLQFTSTGNILSHPTLEHLEISGWKVNSLSIPLSQLSPSSSKLKVLLLPLGTANPGLSLSELRLIAVSCPNVLSFQSSINDLQNIPAYHPLRGAVNALSHGLEILSVGNPLENSNPKEILDVARHLFILFPYLKEIRTHEGQNEEQWKYIHSLVQMFQTVRLDDAPRQRARLRALKK